jgi:hypothetical protein
MTWRAALVIAAVAVLAFSAWRSQLFTVSRPGERPRALSATPAGQRAAAAFDVLLPTVPVGTERLTAGHGVLLIHYWAPWEHHSLDQATRLDSLRRSIEFAGLRAVIVCFDPFPSVARYVGRNRLRVPVLLDGRRALVPRLPCPSMPYTYVIDAAGRIAVAQPGEVDWLAPATREVLRSLLAEPEVAPVPEPAKITSCITRSADVEHKAAKNREAHLGRGPGGLRGDLGDLVELNGIEPSTSCMPCKRSPN